MVVEESLVVAALPPLSVQRLQGLPVSVTNQPRQPTGVTGIFTYTDSFAETHCQT